MKIEFVNHASFIASTDHARVLSDPWLEGKAFNDGWGLLSETKLKYDEFQDITHIWFSHEHPDHFHPPTLKKIPEAHRAKITIVFQKTIDQKVADYVRKTGFAAVHELEPGRWERIADDLEVYCCPWEGFEDSWICMRSPEVSLLNVNDCTVNTLDEVRHIQDQVGDIDVLFTQFGISAWDGNADDLERRLAGAEKMVERTVMHSRAFQPKFVVPFASFIWFCHEENFYMNSGLTPVGQVAEAIESQSDAQPVVLYPGDEWTVGASHDNQEAIRRYSEDQRSVEDRQLVQARTVDRGELISASQQYCRKLTQACGRHRILLNFAKKYLQRERSKPDSSWWRTLGAVARCLCFKVPTPKIHVNDLGQSFEFDLRWGLRAIDLPVDQCDVALGSESLLYAFSFMWGGETLIINGRFREIRTDSRLVLTDYFHLAGNINAGKRMSWSSMLQKLTKHLPVMRRAVTN